MVEEKLTFLRHRSIMEAFEAIVPISYGTLSPYKDNIGIKFHDTEHKYFLKV